MVRRKQEGERKIEQHINRVRDRALDRNRNEIEMLEMVISEKGHLSILSKTNQ
jgi:hypothetical protein